jgi:hypothetical protein
MLRILPYINNWFFAKQSYIDTFSKNDSRVEGWFKGELFFLFDILKRQRIIIDFDREFIFKDNKTNKIDFRINIQNNFNFIELKPLCISQAFGTPRNLNYYFRDDKNGIINDFRKLELINLKNKWVVAFVYPKPIENIWNQTCSTIPTELNHWKCISDINKYPDYLFISLWKSSK